MQMIRPSSTNKMIVRCMLALCSLAVLQLSVMESAVAEEPGSGLNLPSQGRQQSVLPKRVASAPTVSSLENSVEAKPASVAPKPRAVSTAKGPYYVDFRARTAATYGHAFVWYGKTSERKVEVAGLAPAGDVLPYVLGHLAWVPSETGATYGDLDVQYLTASYRVYLSEQDAKRVFAYIKKLQANSPLWNAELNNCTAFLGSIAGFMGLKTPFHLQLPEEYVNSLKRLNGGRQTVQLAAE